jgi:hypothetical protein
MTDPIKDTFIATNVEQQPESKGSTFETQVESPSEPIRK